MRASTWIFFAWWQSANSRLANSAAAVRIGWFVGAIVVGVVLRLWAQTYPYNFDFTVFVAVSDAFLAGQNPYELGTWHYGPTYFIALGFVRVLFEDPGSFRLGLSLFLILVDVLIAFLLVWRKQWLAAVLFLIAPVTFAISGQHAQFDNFSVLLALAAALLVTQQAVSPKLWRDVIAMSLLGLSLSVKHAFLVLPIWIALMQTGWKRKVLYAVVPYVVFGLTLLPYWLIDQGLIRKYVVGFRSVTNAPAYYTLFPDELVWGWVNRGYIVFIFLGILAVLGWWYRRLPAFEATLIYGISLVVFSTAIVDQYFAIPMAGISVFLNIGFLAWLVYVSIYLLGEPEDFNLPIFDTLKLHLAPYQEGTYRDQFIFIFIGWIIMNVWLWRQGWIKGRPSRDDGFDETEKHKGERHLGGESDSRSTTTQ